MKNGRNAVAIYLRADFKSDASDHQTNIFKNA